MLPDVSIWPTPFSPFLRPQIASVHSVHLRGAPQELDILMAMNSEMGSPIIPCLGIVKQKMQNKQLDYNCAIRCSAFKCGWENPQDSCAQLAFGHCLSGSDGGRPNHLKNSHHCELLKRLVWFHVFSTWFSQTLRWEAVVETANGSSPTGWFTRRIGIQHEFLSTKTRL